MLIDLYPKYLISFFALILSNEPWDIPIVETKKKQQIVKNGTSEKSTIGKNMSERTIKMNTKAKKSPECSLAKSRILLCIL